MARVAFVNPPAPQPLIRRYMCSYHAGPNRYPVVELLGLAALARERGHEVTYIDGIAEHVGEACGEALRAFRPDVVVGLGGLESYRDDVVTLVALGRAVEAPVGVMGHFATLWPERSLALGVDFVLRGEGEAGLVAWLDGTPGPGLTTREQDGGPAPRLTDAGYAALPRPAHDLLDPEAYREVGVGRRLAVLQLMRGCPFPCPHCIRSYGQDLCRRPPEQVVAEFREVARRGFEQVRILDDTFTAHRAWTLEVCRALREARLGMPWSALSRVDTSGPEVLRAMASAGCTRVYLGIESGSPRVLDYYKKRHTAADVHRVVRDVQAAGMEAVGFFVLGAPDETWEDVEASISLAINSGLDFVILNTLAAYPGTPIARDRGRVPYVDPWSEDRQLVDPARLGELQGWERAFYRRFYLRRRGLRSGLSTLRRDPSGAVRSGLGVLRFVALGPRAGDRTNLI